MGRPPYDRMAGKSCPATCVDNGEADKEKNGRENGRGGDVGADRLCARVDLGAGSRPSARRAPHGGVRTGVRGARLRRQDRSAGSGAGSHLRPRGGRDRGLEARPARPFNGPPDRDCSRTRRQGRGLPVPHRGRGHHHARRRPDLPSVRSARPVRARPDPRAHERRSEGGGGARKEGRPKARGHRR